MNVNDESLHAASHRMTRPETRLHDSISVSLQINSRLRYHLQFNLSQF